MKKTKEQIRKELEYFLNNSDMSTYEISAMFNMLEEEVVNILAENN